MVSSLNVINRVVCLFRRCSESRAQRQFAASYPRSLSMRSMLCAGDGRGPMSRRKTEKSSHSGLTTIPRPPYLEKLLSFGLLQRWRMAFQISYSGIVPEAPCFLLESPNCSRCRQPHDCVLPLVSWPWATVVGFPQSQRHFHIRRAPRRSDSVVTTSLPNLLPSRFNLLAGGVLTGVV